VNRLPDGRAARLFVAGGFAAVGATGAALGVWVIAVGYSPVPFADFWGQFPFLERALGGDLTIADLWAQSNEHRIFVPRLEYLLDYRFFHGTNVFLFVVIAVSCVLIAAVVAATVWLETRDRLVSWAAFCAATVAALSPVSFENLYWAFQVHFVQVFLFGAVAIVAVVLAARSGHDAWAAASALAAVAATYSLGNGLLVWPVLIVLAAALALELRTTLLLAAAGALTVFSYLWHYDVTTHGNLSHPVGLVKYAAVYLGSALRDEGKTAAGIVGAVGLLALILLCVFAWRDRAGRSIATPAGVGIALFIALTAFQTAAGRLDLGIEQALSSRYATASFVFWLGLLLGFLRMSSRLNALACIGAAAVLALVIGITGRPSRVFLHSTVVGKEITVLAFRAGVDDPSGTLTGVPPSPVVTNALRWMRKRELGPWAPGGLVADSRFRLQSVGAPPPCRGGIESVEPVGGGLRLRGWLAPPSRAADPGQLAVLDDTAQQVGIGLVGTYRPEVQDSSDWTGFVAYVRGNIDPQTPYAVVLIGADRRSTVCGLK
jgi:hypothetical protein